jgi:hypothetical protein
VVTFSGAGLQYECAAALSTDPTPSYTDCASPWSVPTLAADGSYDLSVREKSLANDGTPATVSYTLDTVAQVSVTAPASPGTDLRPTWGISAEPAAVVTCSLDSAADVACTGGFTPTADLTEGSHTLDVTGTDPAGNTATESSTYVLDLTAPAAPAAVTGAQGTGNDTTPTWSWTDPEDVTALCTLTGPGLTGTESPCSSHTSETPTLSGDGDYQLSVVLQDAAGNRSAATPGPTYTLDTTPSAAAAFSSGPTGTGTTATVTWSFTEPGASSTCDLVGAQTGTASSGPCTSPATFVLPGDDTWKLVVTEDDGNGNTVATTSSGYTLDTTGPDAPVVASPSGLSNNATPHVTWTGELPSTAQCRWQRTVGGVTTDGPWTGCDARYFDPTLPGDGSYLFQAQLTDTLGNVGAIGTTGTPYVYDGTPPSPPALTTPSTPGNDTTPTVTFTPEAPGGTAACTSYSGTTEPAAPTWTDCTGGSFTPTLSGDGTWTLAVTLTDQAGNTSAPTTFGYVLDTGAPTAVTIAGPTGPSSSLTPSWTLSGDPTDTITCRLLVGVPPSGGQVGSTTTCTTTFDADLTGQPDGDYTVQVTASDGAGNATVSTWPYTLDTTAPSSPVLSGPTGTGNVATPTWTFSPQAGTTAQCRLVEGLAMSGWTDCSAGSYAVPDPADGTYTVDVLVTDAAGNAAPIASSAPYTSDRTAPLPPVVTAPASPGRDTAPTWSWSGEAGVGATCRLDHGTFVGSSVACDSGTFSTSLTVDDSYVLTVQLTDAAGNSSSSVTSAAYVLDTAAPSTPTVSGPSGLDNATSATWTWGAEAGATSTCVLVKDGVPGPASPCASGDVVALPADGAYELDVTVTDAAGNASAVGRSATYTLDATAPAAPSVVTPTSPASDRSPDFTFTAESGATAQCQWLSGSTVILPWAACTSPYAADLSASPDADYLLQVRVTDAAGNVSAVGSSLAYRLDTAAPAAPVVSMPSGPATTTTPTVTWTGEAGSTGSCVLTHDGVAQPAAACATPWQPTLAGDGSWSVAVTLSDQAGNTSTAGTAGPYVLDTTAPGDPQLTAPTSPGRTATPVWQATLGTGDTAECQTTAGTTTLSTWAACAFPYTTDLSGQPDGTYTLSVRAVDEVDLRSGVVSGSYVLDTTGPLAPSVAAPASPAQSTSPLFGFTAEPGSTTSCAVTSGATVVSPSAPCTSPVTVDLSARADGTYTLSVTATDQAGNAGAVGSASYVLDRAAPDAPVTTSRPASPSPSRTPAWSFSAEAGATLHCTVTGSQGNVVQSGACSSPFTATLVTDDTYTVSVTATDAAGNVSAATVESYELDTQAPAVPVLTTPTSPSQSTSVTWGVQSAEGTVECRLVLGATVVVDWTTCTSGFATTLSGPDGSYVLSARGTDAAGNVSGIATSSYVLDRTAPVPPTVGTPVSPAKILQPTWSVAGSEPGLAASCSVAGPSGPVSAVSCSAPVGGAAFTTDLSGLADGSYTLTVRVTDAAGNSSSTSGTPYVLDTTAPQAVLVTAPKTPSPLRTVSWTLVGDTDATLECSFTGPGLPAATFATCPGSAAGQGTWNAALTTAVDGAYVLTVRSRDAAGNLGPEVASTYVLDTVAPAAPSGLNADHPSPSNASVVSWTFALASDSTGLCQLLSPTAVVATEQACASPWRTDLGAVGDGVYTLSVRAVDAAGNLSGSVSRDYSLDRTPSAAPVITKTPGSPSPVTTPVWNVEISDPSDLLECQLLGLAGSGWAPCGSTVGYDLAPATGGSYTLQVRETDVAGNTSAVTSSATYLLDKTVPVPPDVDPPAVSPDNLLSPVFTISRGQGDAGEPVTLTCTVTRFDGRASTATPCAFGKVTVPLPGLVTRSQGLVTLAVTSTDAAGNQSGAASAAYLYDGIPPAPAVFRPLASDTGTSPRVTWSFGAPADTASALREALASAATPGTTFRCQLAKAGVAPSERQSTACRSPHTELLTQVGTWALWVWAVDPAGNLASPVSSRYTFVSRIPAVTDLTGPSSGSSRYPVWTFTVPVGYAAHCMLTNASDGVLADVACSSGRYVGDLGRAPYGSYAMTVQLLDPQGLGGPYTRSSPYALRAASSSTPSVVHHAAGSPPVGQGPGHLPRRPATGPNPYRVPRPPATVGAQSGSKRSVVTASGGFITPDVPKAIGKTLAQVAHKPTIPLVLLGIVVGFLLLQNRIDRRDPKLASAPVGAEPELDFGPVQGPDGLPGGAPA